MVHFFQNVVGEPVIGKEVLSRRTHEYQGWVEAFARNHAIAIEWAEPKVRKEDYVRPALLRMERARQHGVYFILKSMEQGQTFRSTVPRFATADPNYRILARQRSRFTHYYFYIRDEELGPIVDRAQLAHHPLCNAASEDLGNLVGGQPPQTYFTTALENLVDGEMAFEDEVAAIFDRGALGLPSARDYERLARREGGSELEPT